MLETVCKTLVLLTLFKSHIINKNKSTIDRNKTIILYTKSNIFGCIDSVKNMGLDENVNVARLVSIAIKRFFEES